MRILSPDALLEAWKGGRLAPVYLLAGPDGFRAERSARWLRRKVLEDDAAGLNGEVFYAEDAAPGAVAQACASYPLFGGRRFVWLRHGEALPAGAAVEPLLRYLAAPSPSTVLVITSAKLDQRLKLTAACAESGSVVEFALLGGAALLAQVQRMAHEHGVRLQPGADATLIGLVGEDLGELDAELAKLALAVPVEGAIGAAEVEELVSRSRDVNAFALADQLDARNPRPALAAWLDLRATGGDPIGGAAIVAWKLRQLAQLRAAIESGLDEAAALRALGIPPWQGRRLGELARGTTLAALERALEQWRIADRRAKSSSLGDALAYDIALLDWAARAAGAA